MCPTLPDDAAAWADDWREQLNDREEFERAAADLAGTVHFEIRPDDAYGGAPVVLSLAIEDGACTDVTVADQFDSADDAAYDVAIRGPYGAWKDLLQDEVDVAEALAGGTFETDGDRLWLLRHRAAVAELVAAARAVETEFAN